MKNCIIAQSGGPTSVINASAIGIYEKNLQCNYFDTVYFGINGIQGILNDNILDTSSIPKEELLNLKYTPSSGLGSCRYKLKDFKECDKDFKNVISILENYNIDTFFYIGGNDSMDTIYKLSNYAQDINCKIKFIGIPKTIDNDLFGTDHCPGYGSASKLISTITLETFLDSSVYPQNGIFILETMGRDTGWLAASSALAKLNNTSVADLIYLPEVYFDIPKFLKDVKSLYKKKNQVYIVVSEGIKDANGNFIAENDTLSHDNFGHKQLGGACEVLKELIINAQISSRVKCLELGVIQRCAMHCASETDLKEAEEVGAYGIELSKQGLSGIMATIERNSNSPYTYSMGHVDISLIANKIKYFPSEWINKQGNHITKEAIEYINPLIECNVTPKYSKGLPLFSKIY